MCPCRLHTCPSSRAVAQDAAPTAAPRAPAGADESWEALRDPALAHQGPLCSMTPSVLRPPLCGIDRPGSRCLNTAFGAGQRDSSRAGAGRGETQPWPSWVLGRAADTQLRTGKAHVGLMEVLQDPGASLRKCRPRKWGGPSAHRAPGDPRWGTPYVASGLDSARGISPGRLGYPFHGTAWAPVPEGCDLLQGEVRGPPGTAVPRFRHV